MCAKIHVTDTTLEKYKCSCSFESSLPLYIHIYVSHTDDCTLVQARYIRLNLNVKPGNLRPIHGDKKKKTNYIKGLLILKIKPGNLQLIKGSRFTECKVHHTFPVVMFTI